MGLKFGYRKLGITPKEWNAKNTIYTKTAGGKFGPRKHGNLAPDPALAVPSPEVIPPPPATMIGMLNVEAALQTIKNDVTIDTATLFGSELNRPREMAPRVSVLRALLTRAEGEQDGPLVDLIATEIDKLTRKPEENETE